MNNLWTIALAAAVILGAACSKNQNPLESPAGAVSAATVDGAVIDASVDEWPGSRDTLSEVTPVKVSISNTSNDELRLQYKNFRLVAADGSVYRALPPMRVEGTVSTPIDDPDFYYDGFAVAPHHGPVYPGIGVYDGPFGYDPLYYDTYYSTWSEVRLPTTTMLRRALPEGVLQPGGKVTGYLYFQRVDQDKERATLRADMVDAGTGRVIGTATIPFNVRG